MTTIREALANGAVSFKYTKVDGSIRKATGTTKTDLIPEDKLPKGEAESVVSEAYIRYFDTDVNEWRAFITDNLIEFTA
jgi:hypothetical protein